MKYSSFEGSDILVTWNNRKFVNNDMPKGYVRDYDDVKILAKYLFELSLGEDWFELLMKYASLEFWTRLDIRRLSGWKLLLENM